MAWARIGPVRDADVLIERIRNQAASFDNASRAAVGTLIEVLVADRETARAEMLAALGSNRYPALLRWLAAAVSKPLPVATGSGCGRQWRCKTCWASTRTPAWLSTGSGSSLDGRWRRGKRGQLHESWFTTMRRP